jgi:hypothetical protein
VMIFELAATQFSLIVYESIGAVWDDESIRHQWKQFRGLFLTGRRLNFPWLLMSRQGLCVLTNPRVTSGNTFGEDFWEGSDSVFLHCFWVNRCCVRWGFHASSPEAVSKVISEGQRLSFLWLFMSKQGLCGLTNPFITCENSFGGYLWLGGDSVFLDCLWVNRGCVRWRIHWSPLQTFSGMISERAATLFSLLFLSEQVLCALRIPCVISGSSFGGYFWVGSDSVFLDCWWVNRGCVGWRIHSSSVKAVSGAIYEWVATQFSLTVYESTWTVWDDESFVTCESSFGGYFWVVSDSVFLDCSWVNRGCVGWRIHSSRVKAVPGAISEWSATQFSLMFSESTGAVGVEDSLCHLWKQFHWRFPSGQRLSFPWLFMSQQGLCGLTNPFLTSNSSVRGYFWVVSDSVFLDVFSVNRCCARWGFLRHLCKQFPWWFLGGQRLSFPWHFLSQQVLCALRIPYIIYGSSFGSYFWVGSDSLFFDC